MMTIELQSLLFILIRITSFIVVVPGISNKNIPNTAKMAISLVLSFLVYSTIPAVPPYGQTLAFALAAAREAIIGMSAGFVVKLLFSGIEMAGQLIDYQVGYSMGAIYDPVNGTASAYYGKLFHWLAVLIFFILDFHHIMIAALIGSFKVIPPGQLGFGSVNLQGILYFLMYSFKIALSLAAPVIIVLLVTDIVLGMLSRTVPQINVFMLGMPLKGMICMVMVLMLISFFMSSIGNSLGLVDEFMQKAIEIFR